jgi:hypothetical protein
MSVSKAQINWTAVSFGVSPTPTPITRVTNASFGMGGTLIKFKGDTDLYPTIIASVDIEPHASITTADVGTMMNFSPGTTATLTATLNDAKGVTLGAVVFTMVNAVFENADTQAQHAQFGSVTGTWQAFSSDGVTPPLGFTRA